jgi:predicted CXXCH cytochrome family protein
MQWCRPRGILSLAVGAIAFAALILLFAGAHPSNAAAAEPSVIDTENAGLSSWSYKDLQDTSPKYEGGYAAFEETATSLFTTNPHGGYNTTTNKCKICHAVHRAESSYYLMRADSQGDVCIYCHVGSSHSSKNVYDGPGGMGTSNGHRIGAPPAIPASTTYMVLEQAEITSVDASGNATTVTVPVRSADAGENRMFALQRRHGQNVAGNGRFGYARVGPTALTCMSCHQVHGAVNELWRPLRFPNHETTVTAGYKMLRATPSGSVQGPDDQPYESVWGSGPPSVSYTRDGMQGYQQYADFATTGLVNKDNVVRVPESTLTAGSLDSSGTYGPGVTTWDSPPFTLSDSSTVSWVDDPATVDQYALSVWCADCHNLTIGSYPSTGAPELGLSAHESSRTHSVPMSGAGNGPGQCFTCHREGLSSDPETSAIDPARAVTCERCHYGTGTFAADRERRSGDFPHSGATSSTALLGAWSTDASGSIVPTEVTSANVSTTVCLRCHVQGSRTHDSTLSVP